MKSPSLHNGAAHFTTKAATGAAPATIATADVLDSAGDFSTFTIASTPGGAYGASVVLTPAGTYTVYLRSASPYPLAIPAAVTVT
jgi:hypothetical protein